MTAATTVATTTTMAKRKRTRPKAAECETIGVRRETKAEAMRVKLMLSVVEGDVATYDTVIRAALALLRKKVEDEIASSRAVSKKLRR